MKINGRTPARGDIIQLDFNPRVGSEQSGHRPAIVISPESYNQLSKLILVCPITSKEKGWPFEVKLPPELKTYGVVLTDQLRAIDCNTREARFIERSTPELIDEVLRKIETLTA